MAYNAALDEASQDLFHSIKDFVLDYNGKLGDIREVLSDTLAEAWDSPNEFIGLSFDPISSANPREILLQNESHQSLNKILSVWSLLSDEITSLEKIAADKFYGPLTMFAHTMDPIELQHAEKRDKTLLQTYYQSQIHQTSTGVNIAQAGVSTGTNYQGKGIEEQMGAFLPILQDLANFLKRLQAVLSNAIAQLSVLFNEHTQIYLTTFKNVDYDIIFNLIARGFTIVITIDQILSDNVEITNAWSAFKKMIQYVSADSLRFGINDEEELSVMKQLVTYIDNSVMNVRLYEKFLTYPYTSTPKTGQTTIDDTKDLEPSHLLFDGTPNKQYATTNHPIFNNKTLANVIESYIQRQYIKVESSLKQFIQLEYADRRNIMPMFIWYTIYRQFFGQVVKFDKNLYRNLWSFQLSIPVVYLVGRSSWYIPEFLYQYAKVPKDYGQNYFKPLLKEIVTSRQDILKAKQDDFFPTVELFYIQVTHWLTRLTTALHIDLSTTSLSLSPTTSSQQQQHLQTSSALSPVQQQQRLDTLLQGIMLAQQIRSLVVEIIHLTFLTQKPFSKRVIFGIFTCVELLHVIQAAYRRNTLLINHHYPHLLQHIIMILIAKFQPIDTQFKQGDYGPKKLGLQHAKNDLHISLTNILTILNSQPITTNQYHNTLSIIQLSYPILSLQLLYKNQPSLLYYLDEQIWKLQTLLSFNSTITTICETSFMYWLSNAVKILLSDIFSAASQRISRLYYVGLMTQDCSTMLYESTKYFTIMPSYAQYLVSLYQAEVRTYIHQFIVAPICTAIETDLRLHIHSVVLDQKQLMNQKTSVNKDLKAFILLNNFTLFNEQFSIKHQIERFLESSFYNHNTLALHDTTIYNSMKNLASYKYNLSFLPLTMLPTASHFSGSLDVLEIMRNVHIFVNRYNYSLQQFFIEKSFDQKHLNIITIDHISTSIQTHGLGIMNTTVNYTYQFLCRKIFIIHEFLFDEHIKSPLLREFRMWSKDGKKLHNNKFPYDNAMKIYKDIKKLGVSNPALGLTYIDQLRLQITEIGNALGYVRLVRSGGLTVLAQNSQILPTINYQQTKSFKELAQQSQLSTTTQDASEIVDTMVLTIINNLSSGTNYFYLLLTVFDSIININENPHLNVMFLILPTVIINFVETLMQKKEKLVNKHAKTEAAFCDDGFAVGVAYLLTLFHQDEQFDSLHWFESILDHFKQEKAQLQKDIDHAKKSRQKEYDFEHSNLRVKRIDLLIREYETAYFTINSARTFFRSAVEENQTEEKKQIIEDSQKV